MPQDIARGFLVKQGAVRKNWKRRWFVLREDGHVYYYKTNRPGEHAIGVVNIRDDCQDLLWGDECPCAWPDPEVSGKALVKFLSGGQTHQHAHIVASRTPLTCTCR